MKSYRRTPYSPRNFDRRRALTQYDPMRGMLRRLPIFSLALTALLIAEPLLHTHPLQQRGDRTSSNSVCAVCATGIGRLPIVTSTISAPQHIVYVLRRAAVTIVTVVFALPLTSRAPPAL